MPLFGTIVVWAALAALVASFGLYLFGGPRAAKWGRAAFFLAAACVFAAAATLGVLLVTHRFDVAYVFQHSARAMAPLYWFPAFWAGQEGSFLLWAFWISVLGVVLAITSGRAERRVMPIYGSVLLFLIVMLAVRSPFVPLDTQGQPVPTEGQGLNPNLENYWMVIHPPTLFLGFSALTVPFAFALSALFWRDWDGWLRRALPWSLFGFAVLGLAMMMGGYWAYEMLGWGGFWEWDPVENGPFVPWIALVAFLHAAQIQRVRGGFQKPTLFFGLLPFVGAMYESFLTRTGVLSDFSVHSFSELGGAANNLLIGALLLSVFISVGMLWRRSRELKGGESTLDTTNSREFGYTMAMTLLTLAALIAGIGMSMPLISAGAVKLGWMGHTASVKEDFYNRAMFPLAILLAAGLGVGPWLAWKGRGATDSHRLGLFYMVSVIASVAFVLVGRFVGSPLPGPRLAPELILFTAAVFALLANGALLIQRLRLLHPRPSEGEGGEPEASRVRGLGSPAWTVGGFVSHIGAAVLLIGLVCLVTFVHKDTDVLLVKDLPQRVLGGAYEITYLGQTGDFQTDRDNVLRFRVASQDGKESFLAAMPFALRAMEGGDRKLIGHPAISHHAGGDLYLALKDGPDEFYPRGRTPLTLKLGATHQWGPYTLQFVKFERDPQAAAFVQATGQMPPVFPVWADLRVTYRGKTTLVRPQSITLQDNPLGPKSPEITLPGGALLSFDKMNAGSADKDNPNAGAMDESGSFVIREPGPVMEAFQIDVTTRPMINFIWLGTLLMFFGGLMSMRRRVLENRAIPIPDLPVPAPPGLGAGGASRRRAKGRAPTAKPAPSLAAMRGKGR
ncbi:MAG: cytochrome c biogenesis protein CcsA [Armatimonadetes bacterium]|nr:cytochrome c biogenesis protein CcsA [Armatimonadota bacterium]